MICLVLLLLPALAFCQLDVTVSAPAHPEWYEACARQAWTVIGISVDLPSSAFWYIEVKPASFFASPGILASTVRAVSYDDQWASSTFINGDHDYYFGLDGSCPSDSYDAVTVLMHEQLHSLAFNTPGFEWHTFDSLCKPVGEEGSLHTPYYFDCEYEIAGTGYHLAGDALMSPVLDPGASQHMITCADMYVMEKTGWNVTGLCASASRAVAPLLLMLLLLAA